MGEQRNLTPENVEEVKAKLEQMAKTNPDLKYRFFKQMKHTPGPQEAGRPDMFTLIEGYSGKYVYGDDKYVAAAVGLDIENPDEIMANARLIAAAPELLEILRLVLAEAIDDYYQEHDENGILARAREAIKKASDLD